MKGKASLLFCEQMKFFHMSPTMFDLLFCSLIALAATVWQLFGISAEGHLVALYSAAVCWLSLVSGRMLSFWGDGRQATPTTDMMNVVGGAFLIQLSVFVGSYFLRVSVVVPFVLGSILITSRYFFVREKVLCESAYRGRKARYVLLLLGVMLAAITLWSQQALTQYELKNGKQFFQPSIDYYTHTGQFLPFIHGDFSQGNFFFSGLRVFFYHFGSYMFSAVAAGMGVESALNMTTSFWLPFSLLLMAFSAFAMGAEFGGFRAGLGAVFALLLIPDPSAYLFFNRFFSFHWLVQLSPGCAYGLALLSYGFIWLFRYIQKNRWQSLLLVFMSLVSMLFIRAQFIPLSFLLVGVWGVFFVSRVSFVCRSCLFGAGIGILALRSWIVSTITLAPSLTGPPGGAAFIHAALQPKFGGEYWGLAATVLGAGEQWKIIGGGFLLIMFSVLGAYLPFALLFLWRKAVDKSLVIHWDILPWLALICYCLLAWLLPVSTRSNPYELLHRPFVVVYYFFAVWVGSQTAVFLWHRYGKQLSMGAVALISAAGLLTPLYQGEGIHGGVFSHMPLQQGVYDAAVYLREHGADGEVFIDTGFNHYGTIGVVALSEKRAFFSPTIASAVNRNFPEYKKKIRERLAFRRKLNNIVSAKGAGRMAQEKGIRWAVIQDGHRSAWEEYASGGKVFESHNTRVYDMRLLSGADGPEKRDVSL